MESLWWTTPEIRKRFRQTPETAEITKLLAFNQGFYNLFLAVGALAGPVLTLNGQPQLGVALSMWSCLSMFAAALVLAASARQMVRGAIIQGAAPLIFLVLATIGALN